MKLKFAIVFAAFFLVLPTPQCLTQAAADQRQELASHIKKAQEYLREKRPEMAIPELKAAVAIDPDNMEIQGNLGVLLYFQGDFSGAVPHLRGAVLKDPSLAKIQGLLGIAELRTQDFAGARRDLETALPQITDRVFKTQAGLELVGLYTQSGDLDDAARVVAELRKSDPDNAEVTYAAYRTYTDLAGESMLALSLSAPDSAQMHQIIAHEETKQGNTNGAIAHYRKALALDPHLPGAHFELAELLHSASDEKVKSEAEQEYRAALAQNPQDEKTICRLGEIDLQKGNVQQAFEEFSRATKLQPADADAKLDLAKTLIQMNQADKAQALLEETVQQEPTNAIAHYRLATLYRKSGRVEDAKREVDLYKKYKDLKEKLNAIYKELQIRPNEILEEPDEK
jgi:FimV-like protein